MHAAALALLATVALVACGDDEPSAQDPSGGESSATAARPDATFGADVEVVDDAVRVHYSFTNTAAGPVTVLNRVPSGTSGAAVDYDPTAAYVTDADGGREVVVSQQVFARPDTDGENLETTPVTGATALGAGETLEGDVTVDRPFVRADPYDDGNISDDAATVRFCLGVIATPLVGGDTRTVGDAGLLVVNDDSTFERQYLFCSDPAQLD